MASDPHPPPIATEGTKVRGRRALCGAAVRSCVEENVWRGRRSWEAGGSR
ncbi:hypothetical protein ES332_D11G293300v1 [Gossypium tomentosum]|uniref:Uncharacterized protein n=1 Tax=Gossypium tomentosum TaxID=34277 RepID=A0A5D2ITC8_GOSTO|nr:hypothetical protein ES332_D11G293300v1 [Gossypium tomentosum]